jgi:hypothetical protein
MRFFPTSVQLQQATIEEGWKIWLARGEDLAGNPYANVDTKGAPPPLNPPDPAGVL